MKRNAILLVTFGLILLVIGALVMYLNGSFTKNNDLENNSNKILDSYKKFEEVQEIITGERNIINNEVVNNYYDEEVLDNYDNWVIKFNEYENKIKDMDKYKDIITNLCVNKKYKDSKVTSACESMMIGYETQINYFVKDIENFNKFISDYNDNNKDDMKKLYDLSYKYIDINDDGKYLGK